MSKNNSGNKGTKDTEEKQKKTVTKYDRKVQRRKEQKAKEERDKKIGAAVGILLAVALVCFIASFPIRTFLTVNGTYITVDGENVNRVGYDYYYNVAVSNYLNGEGAWLYYAGLNLSGDLSQQMYSEDMSFKDLFDEMTVELISRNKALVKEARAAGFVYDSGEDYKEYMDALREYASEEGTTTKAYIRSMYGSYATESRVKPYVDEIEQYYEEHKDNYDLVDYRVSSVSANLPDAPTELADPVETAAPAEGAEGDGTGTESAYEPSEAEIAAAMEIAKTEADKLENTIKTEGEQTVGAAYSDVVYILREWLFSADRKAGDTTVIEDTTNNRYYVLAFEKRYRNEAMSADVRVILTNAGNGQEILDEWKGGEATEASFAELCDKYNDTSVTSAEGGMYEELLVSSLSEELREWISDSSRVSGDTAVISPADDAYSYVIYYVAPNRAEWIVSIENILRSNQASEYLEGLIDSVNVEDKKGNLNYLKVYAQREAEGENSPEEETPTEAPGEQ